MDLKRELKKALVIYSNLRIHDDCDCYMKIDVSKDAMFKKENLDKLKLILKFLKNFKQSNHRLFRLDWFRAVCESSIKRNTKTFFSLEYKMFTLAIIISKFKFTGDLSYYTYVEFRDVDNMIKDGGINTMVRSMLRFCLYLIKTGKVEDVKDVVRWY